MKALLLLLFFTVFSVALNAQKNAVLFSPSNDKIQEAATSLRREIISLGNHKALHIERFTNTDVTGLEVAGLDKFIGDTVYGVRIFFSRLGRDTVNAEIIGTKCLPGDISSFTGDRIVYLWGRSLKMISYYSRRKGWDENCSSEVAAAHLTAIIQKLKE